MARVRRSKKAFEQPKVETKPKIETKPKGRRKRKNLINVIDIASVIEGLGGNGRVVAATLNCIEKAEKMITDFVKGNLKRKREDYVDMFQYMMPTHGMHMLIGEVYESHCKELLVRRSCNSDLRLATDAELLCILANASLVAPLSLDYATLMTVLYAKVMDEPDVSTEPGDHGESYQGSVMELLEYMRRKHRENWRQAKKEKK